VVWSEPHGLWRPREVRLGDYRRSTRAEETCEVDSKTEEGAPSLYGK
jgi:hypothetical protein